MTLELLVSDMVAAMKQKDGVRKRALSALVQCVKKMAIDEKCKDNVTEELVNKAILKEKKTLQEMIDTCPDSRPDIKETYEQLMVIFDEYAPKLMTDAEEIKSYIAGKGIEFTKENRPAIMKELKGKADLKIVNSLF